MWRDLVIAVLPAEIECPSFWMLPDATIKFALEDKEPTVLIHLINLLKIRSTQTAVEILCNRCWWLLIAPRFPLIVAEIPFGIAPTCLKECFLCQQFTFEIQLLA
jgi:hypothetical protein